MLISIDLLFFYLIFVSKDRKFQFSYLISFEVFLLLLIPHLIWLTNNNYVTIVYGFARTGASGFEIENHLINPLIFIVKQIGILIPFFILCSLLISKYKFKINFKDKKILFLTFISLAPIVLMLITSIVTGSKIRTMWMTPFYLFQGLLVIYIFKNQINFKKINNFIICFIFIFLLSPFIYGYISITKDNKRTDYPGKQIAAKVQFEWDQNFDEQIGFVIGNEWKAGNLSYHLKSRPTWEGFIESSNILNEAKEYICIDDICVGTYK